MSDGALISLCPHCHCEQRHLQQAFCTRCGLALRQPCPNCASPMATAEGAFTECSACQTSFWGCRECGRLYHLDRTSCLNGYCPSKGEFWTATFGSDVWDSRHGRCSVTNPPTSTYSSPLPGWLGGGGGERRFPSLHHSGLLISVQESGILEMWAERGAPRGSEGDEFREESVRLVRLDLGEPAGGSPFLHQERLVVLGSTSLCALEMTSNPSLGHRIELPKAQGLLKAVSLPGAIVLVGPSGIWEVDLDSSSVRHHLELAIETALDPVTDSAGRVLLAQTDGSLALYNEGGKLETLELSDLSFLPEWALYADRFVLIWRNQLLSFDGAVSQIQELPATVVARPVYDQESGRLTVLLSDGTIRTCSTTGERFSFVCDMPGTPTTPPLRLGKRIYYGSEGRYLCCDEEALLPRLNSQPWGELSYANGRLFGTTREGGLFAFCL